MSDSQPAPNVHYLSTDVIGSFLNMTGSDETPELFRKWSAISLVAGALERRVWARIGARGGLGRLAYPNLYVFLVGAPGVGKYIIEDIGNLWREAVQPGKSEAAFHVSPSNMTKASLMDRLAKSYRSHMPLKGPPFEYHSLLVAAEEFQVFLPMYNFEFIGVLNKVFNNPPIYEEERRYGSAKELSIDNPTLNMLGGVQPAWLATVFPEEAWGMGLCSRIIMIYASEGERRSPFDEGLNRPIQRMEIIRTLGELSRLFGEIGFTEEAQNKIAEWHIAGGPPIPNHPKLEHYLRRRTLHIGKLSIISSVSRTKRVGVIELIDVDRAIAWLTEAEAYMPDIFRAMMGKSDSQVLDELYNYLVNLYNMARQAPINESRLFNFLRMRAPSDKVGKMLEMAEKSKMIRKVQGTDCYVPCARKDFTE